MGVHFVMCELPCCDGRYTLFFSLPPQSTASAFFDRPGLVSLGQKNQDIASGRVIIFSHW